MANTYLRWQRLFLFCSGLFIGASFCMKWMESDLVWSGGKISIFGLELFTPKEEITAIFGSLSDKVRTILIYHLSFDFAFMAGCYPGIACLCMMAREKVRPGKLQSLLFILACFQTLAWAFDIFENYTLLKWLQYMEAGSEFWLFRVIVWSKWAIALAGALVALPVLTSKFIKKNELK
jgi:hypothetical protein